MPSSTPSPAFDTSDAIGRGTLAATTGQSFDDREIDERLVVGRIARPRPRDLQELVFGHVAHQEVLERLLHVALEHLERDDDAAAAPRQAFEHRELEPMRVRIVVLLADEDDVRLRQLGQHRLEVDERARRPCRTRAAARSSLRVPA